MFKLSISIFRRLSLFQARNNSKGWLVGYFQSPFSGDFLCFVIKVKILDARWIKDFQSPFSGDFLCFLIRSLVNCEISVIFQSPFSGDFLCFELREKLGVSGKIIVFQSPFSGDFLCFRHLYRHTKEVPPALSISIFRRLSLFPKIRGGGRNELFRILSISIFRRLSLFLLQPGSPETPATITFNLHFQETFFVS